MARTPNFLLGVANVTKDSICSVQVTHGKMRHVVFVCFLFKEVRMPLPVAGELWYRGDA